MKLWCWVIWGFLSRRKAVASGEADLVNQDLWPAWQKTCSTQFPSHNGVPGWRDHLTSPPVLSDAAALPQRGHLRLHRWAELLTGGTSLRVLSAGLTPFVTCSSFSKIKGLEKRRERSGQTAVCTSLLKNHLFKDICLWIARLDRWLKAFLILRSSAEVTVTSVFIIESFSSKASDLSYNWALNHQKKRRNKHRFRVHHEPGLMKHSAHSTSFLCRMTCMAGAVIIFILQLRNKGSKN